MKITDIVSASSAAIGALTGVIMAVLAYREFLKSPEQEEADTGKNEEDDDSLKHQITIFQTSNQTTVLRVKDNMLECEIFDKRRGKGGVQWSFPAELCRKIVEQKMVHANPNYKRRTGQVSIGPRKNWLYSKTLFWDPTILENDIYSLLKNVE